MTNAAVDYFSSLEQGSHDSSPQQSEPIMNPLIEVGVSPTLGVRGVIAKVDILAGTVLERCPVVLIPIGQRGLVNQTVLGRYYFEWSGDFDALLLGFGSLYNHRLPSNADYFYHYDTREISIEAVRDIKAGEEVFINYNGLPDADDEVDPKYLMP